MTLKFLIGRQIGDRAHKLGTDRLFSCSSAGFSNCPTARYRSSLARTRGRSISVLGWFFRVIDDQNLDRSFLRFELQSELLSNGPRQIRESAFRRGLGRIRRPTAGDPCMCINTMPGGRVHATSMTLKFLIEMVYSRARESYNTRCPLPIPAT